MRKTQLFTKTLKNAPSDEVSRNAQLLIRAGYFHKEMAGVYDYLPLGLMVAERIKQIVREEMNAIGSHEILMTSLQRKEVWEQTDRWSDEAVDVWFKTQLQNGHELGLGWSHEEPITDMMKQHVASHNDLPAYVYQFQNKLRNELRAKSGIMRGREFQMKDLYSYSSSVEQHEAFYAAAIEAYKRVFERLGIGDSTYFTYADGGAFTGGQNYSHEFQTVCDAGEDIIYIHQEKHIALNEEVLTDELLKALGIQKEDLTEAKAAEVGNIFSFGTGKCEQLGLFFQDENGERKPVVLGSYGIGISRLIGVIVELMADDKGLVWPENISPYTHHIISLAKSKEEPAYIEAEQLHDRWVSEGKRVYWDDRLNVGPGQKFGDADLLGFTHRYTVSERSLRSGGYEYSNRLKPDEEAVIIAKDDL